MPRQRQVQPRNSSKRPHREDPVDSAAHPDHALAGVVTRSHGLWHEVAVAGQGVPIIATLRGQLKRQRRGTDPVAVGDRVWVSMLPDNEAVIEAVEPRTRTLGRIARHTRDVEQVILANPDQVLFVFAFQQPVPHLRMLDRFIILAELSEIPIRIVVSKVDLDEPGAPNARALFADHERSFPVHYVSARSGEGMSELREVLAGKVSAVAGPSGVGKSSLLNVLDPEPDRDVAEVSAATGKGRHTTVGARLHDLGGGTFVADTPGMRALTMVAVPEGDLDWAFRELRPYLGSCRYPDCTHVHEPGCQVQEAVEHGDIPLSRYESYVLLRTGDELASSPDWA
ncbi:MAG TPA: ribosome small subunit-dependent GTPase A [Thermomicrobiales bacterium]|nr:ribosome small subunit-dependent GTPase A [Thermomicrobiales bacterium]